MPALRESSELSVLSEIPSNEELLYKAENACRVLYREHDAIRIKVGEAEAKVAALQAKPMPTSKGQITRRTSTFI